MESKLEPPIEQGEGVSEGDETSDSEKSNPITITKRAFGGVIRDFQVWKGRKRDFKDGISVKCLGAVFFIYLLLIAVIATIGEHNWTSSGGFMVGKSIYLGEKFLWFFSRISFETISYVVICCSDY